MKILTLILSTCMDVCCVCLLITHAMVYHFLHYTTCTFILVHVHPMNICSVNTITTVRSVLHLQRTVSCQQHPSTCPGSETTRGFLELLLYVAWEKVTLKCSLIYNALNTVTLSCNLTCGTQRESYSIHNCTYKQTSSSA